MARARKSSSWRAERAGRSVEAESTGYCSESSSLLAGEFIVSLQVMRSNIDGLRLRMVAEVDCHPSWLTLAAQQESDRRGARRVVFQGFDNGAAHRRGSKLDPAGGAVVRSERRPIRPAAKAWSNRDLLSGTACSRRPPGVA